MTTIIAHKGRLIADRRKVKNILGYDRGLSIVGAVDEAKIFKLPFCYYGIAGFDPSSKLSGISDKISVLEIEQRLAVLHGVNFLLSDKASQLFSSIYPDAALVDYDVFYTAGKVVFDLCGQNLSELVTKALISIISIDKDKIFTISDDSPYFVSTEELSIIGGKREMAYILLSQGGCSYQETYNEIAMSGGYTGAKIDIFDTKELPDSIPPFVSELFVTKLMQMCFPHALKSKEEEVYVGCIKLFSAILLNLGKLNEKNEIEFNPEAKFIFHSKKDVENKYVKQVEELMSIWHREEKV